MTERRETGRKPSGSSGKGSGDGSGDWGGGERIAKYLARCGVASRRACEILIEEGKVTVNGERLVSPAFKVTGREDIRVGRKRIAPPEPARLWRYHKPAGLITTNSDPDGRRTIFDELPKSLPRVVTIGRLDLNTEGLLLLTNDGELARALELPANAFRRTYRARAHGRVTQGALDTLKAGVTVDGEAFGPIEAELERQMGANGWLTVSLSEGRKREVRRALEAVDLKVNRLIRTSYGPYSLGDLKPGAVEEVQPAEIAATLGHLVPGLEAPIAAGSRFEERGKGARTGRASTKTGRSRPARTRR